MVFFSGGFLCDSYLKGFVGITTLYINRTALINAYKYLNISLSSQVKQDLFYLNFIRLVVHEITHVVLRKIENNVNVSTPIILLDQKRTHDSKLSLSGYISELELFGERIDFVKTSYIKNFGEKQSNYIREILSVLEKGEISIDALKSIHKPCIFVQNENELSSMGCYIEDIDDSYFE
jgi:hypothetical protein